MKLLKNQLVMSVLGMFIGLALFVFAVINSLKNIETKNFDNFNMITTCLVLGAMIFTVSLMHFIVCLRWRKNPEFRRTQYIAAKDERNITIWDKAAARANHTLLLLMILAMVIFTALGEKIYIILTFCGLIGIDGILFFVYSRYLSKRL